MARVKKTDADRLADALEWDGDDRFYYFQIKPSQEAQIRELPGFVPVEQYDSVRPVQGEIGVVRSTRYVVG